MPTWQTEDFFTKIKLKKIASVGRPDSNFGAGGVGHSLEEACEAEASHFWLVDAPKPSRVLNAGLVTNSILFC